MKGNEKVGITAELVAVMRERMDKKYSYFVSIRARILYRACEILFPKLTRQVFGWRILLSDELDRISENNEQVIELAAGYNLRNFEKALINNKAVCIDADLKGIIGNKRRILLDLCLEEGREMPKNFKMINIDLVRDRISEKIKIEKNKRTALIAEGLVTYLNREQFDFLIENVSKFLRKYPKSVFYFNLNLANPKFKGYGLLRAFIKVISSNESYSHFSNNAEIKQYFADREMNVSVKNKKGLIICKVWA